MYFCPLKSILNPLVMTIKTVNIRNISLTEGTQLFPQSMTNSNTQEMDKTVEQAIRIAENGAGMVRISVPGKEDVKAMRNIVQKIRQRGYDFPVIADVHFNPEIAEMLVGVVDKIRINPGNFSEKNRKNFTEISDEEYNIMISQTCDRAKPLIEKCKNHGTAIRVGVNQGSLSQRMVFRYGHTPQALAQSALEWIGICESLDFANVVFSLKASNAHTMTEANKLFMEEMKKRGTVYPLHIGVTEAGYGLDGRVKSAVGIGALLLDGIGSTIRVSLTESPEKEIPFAQHLIDIASSHYQNHYRIQDDVLYCHHTMDNQEKWIAEVGAISGYEHFRHTLKGVSIENPCFSARQNQELVTAVEQACGIRIRKTEIISCPTCSRTDYDIEKVIQIMDSRFSHYPGLKIGVMGCIVNGPGEMLDTDFGIVGAKDNKVAVYQGKNRISSIISLEEGISLLEKVILAYLDNR